MSLFRNLIWFAYGMNHFTKSGLQKASKTFKADDLNVDLKGKVFVITGANAGLGKSTALFLATRGGTVHMLCRDKERGEAARAEIETKTGNANVHLHVVDVSRPSSIRAFADSFLQSGSQLDVLVNNAGVMLNPAADGGRPMTPEGIEATFATNTVGPFLLTNLLLPALKKGGQASPGRMIMVSSGGALTKTLNDDFESAKVIPFDGTTAYAVTKRQEIELTDRFAEMHRASKDVFFFSMHPGWAATPGVQSSMPAFYERMKDNLRDEEGGADTICWLAVNPAVVSDDKYQGQFFLDRQITRKHLPLGFTQCSKALVDKLWVYCMEKSGLVAPPSPAAASASASE